MKQIMISVKTQYVVNILNREKTLEIRKSMPKCELPCKVYIYCTKNGAPIHPDINGFVVAEFTLNRVEELENTILPTIPTCVYLTKTKRYASAVEKESCLSQNEIYNYLGGKNGYAWNIDDLKIYDKPKQLEEFGLKKAPQSWQYIKGEN